MNSKDNTQHNTSLKLVMAIDIIRHGDRTPIHHLPYFSEKWKNTEKGILTDKGKKESLLLGKSLAKYYIEHQKLLSSHFNSDQIDIKSSNYQRTKKTAEYIIQGMYPNTKEVPVQMFDKNQCPLLPHNFSLSIIKEYFHNNEKEFTESINLAINNINKHLNTTFEQQDIGKISDAITVNKAHNIQKPEKLPEQEYHNTHTLGKIARIEALKPKKTSCLAGLPLIKHVTNLLNHWSIKQKTKYFLYISHDAVIMGVLNLLGLENIDPPYLSRIQIELLQDYYKKLYVKMYYNDEEIDICDTKDCPIETFNQLINSKLQQCQN